MSLWWSLTDHPKFEGASLDQQWDVVIVGGGFSGLWTAHHLLSHDSHLKIAVIEQSTVGSGASGRNGGWASALYPIDDARMLKHFSQEIIDSLHHQLRSSIDEIGAFASKEKIDCDFHKGGSLVVARNGGQLERLKNSLEEGSTFLDAQETQSRIRMNGALGSSFTPDCAAINPAALIVGLAMSLERRGVSIVENTRAEFSKDGKVYVGDKRIKAKAVVRAIEAYHANSREQLPIYSLMVATEPLPDHIFEEIGIHNRETFAEGAHLVTYAQRTAENRLAIGGRGAPYIWGSRRRDSNELVKDIHEQLRIMSRTWFPALREFEFTHAWGGAVAVTRDWAAYVRFDGSYGELGGYAGDGVTLSYLAAAAMADLVTQKETIRTALPFAQWRSPLWEREPLRWLGVNAAIKLSGASDVEERITQRPSVLMKLLAPITGQ